MKKILSFTVLLFCLCSLSWAYDFSAVSPSGQTLNFNINSGTYTVTTVSNNGIYGSLTIPSTVTYSHQTYTVTAIGMTAFSYCTGLTSVTIPNTVTALSTFCHKCRQHKGYGSGADVSLLCQPASGDKRRCRQRMLF